MESEHAEIERFREQVEHWRATRSKRSTMPQRLWQRAVVLAKRHGVYQVAKACNLNGCNLKKRLQTRGQNGEREPEFGFVEVPGLKLDGMGMSAAAITVQAFDERGASLRVDYISGEGFDLANLMQTFWSRGQ